MFAALLLGCVPLAQVPSWPEQGCQSTQPLAVGSTLLRAEQHTLATESELAVALLVPMEPGCWPAVVMVPPGIDAGLEVLDGGVTSLLASAGVVVVAYDPAGRGRSGGAEDYGGPSHQDDLAQLLRWTAGRADVDPERVVVLSRSFGVATASGALGRHGDLKVMGLVDLEGPAQLPGDLEHVPEHTRGTLESASQGSEWWLQRSAAQSLGQFQGSYLRIQALTDHATGTWLGHALTLLNVAEQGAPAPVQLNGQRRAIWDYEQVQDAAMEGRVKLDDDRVLALVLGLLASS